MFNINDYTLIDDGTLDTVIGYEIQRKPGQFKETVEVRYAQEEALPYRDSNGVLDFEQFILDHHEDIQECAYMMVQ